MTMTPEQRLYMAIKYQGPWEKLAVLLYHLHLARLGGWCDRREAAWRERKWSGGLPDPRWLRGTR